MNGISIMKINKYEKNMSDIRLKNSLEDYVTKDDLSKVTDEIDEYKLINDTKFKKLEDIALNDIRNNGAVINNLKLIIKIMAAILFISLVFEIIMAISFFKLESNLYGSNDVYIEYKYEELMS